MAVGLRIRNNGNILQIDGTYRNSELVQSGTLALDQADVNGRGWFGIITIPAGKSVPLIAFRASTTGVYWQMDSPTTVKVFSGTKSPTPSPPPINYYIFGEPENSSPGTVGIVIRNTAGVVVYNSNKKYLRILQTISQTIPVDTSVTGNFPGKTVAICQNMRPFRWQIETGGPVGQPIFVLSVCSGAMSTPDASTATVTNRLVASYTGFGSNTPQIVNVLDASYFFIDVTGY